MQLLPETIKTATVDECAREVLDGVPPVTWFIRRQMRSHRGGLSLAQFRSLVRVNRYPNASLSMVAEHLGASLPTTSRIVAGLVDKKLLERHDCRWDRRQVSLDLTPKGRDMLQVARKATQIGMERELENLTPQHRAAIVNAMQILRAVFAPPNEAPPPPAPPVNGTSAAKLSPMKPGPKRKVSIAGKSSNAVASAS
jgi:DNA-binding MarR family transcriptional regulator